ncbi:carbohydrate sulfotransferase 10 isoform X2 [Lepeophtheirus salmonis]|nr:uncharacterized protein LOC121115727 isoform X2 [Lepeophtheirus salmonis]
MRPESRSNEPKKDVIFGFFDHGMILCTGKRVGLKKIKIMSEQSIVSPSINSHVKNFFNKDFPQSLKFVQYHTVLVRHPLERIISVYRAEFEENINVVTKEKTPARMSFPDFIELVVKGPELMMEYKQQMAKKGQSLAADMGLIDGKGLSSLWNSYWNQCGLCHPLFDPEYIIHLETFKEDFKVLNIDVMNSNQNIDKILNIKEDESGNHSSSELDIIEFYYSQLKKKDIQALYEKYRPDHELFGYKPDYFLRFGKD